MINKTYYTTRNPGQVRRLDNFLGPWVDVSIPIASDAMLDVMTLPLEPNKVRVVGRSDEIFWSDDSGATWTAAVGNYAAPLSAGEIREIWIVDSLNMYACGGNGVVLRSVDGGVTFDKTTTYPTAGGVWDSTVQADSIHFITPLIGVVGVTDPTASGVSVWKTTDGGVTWSQLNGGAVIGNLNSVATGIHISATETTIVLEAKTGIYRSTDSGATFSLVQDLEYIAPSIGVGVGTHLTWISDDELWVTTQDNQIFQSIDAGATWSTTRPGGDISNEIETAVFVDINNGYYGTSSGGPADIFFTSDSGATGISSEVVAGPHSIWSEYDNPPPPCFVLTSCDDGGAVFTNIFEGPGINLTGWVGNVINNISLNNGLIAVGCFTVTLQEGLCVGTDTLLAADLVGSADPDLADCAPFSVDVCPAEMPLTIVGDTSTFDLTITNNSNSAQDYTFAFGACTTTGLSITTPAPLNIAAGDTGTLSLSYAPTVAESGDCDITITGPCSSVTCKVCYESIAVPDCPHFNISITGPSCAPDCIKPGEIVQFDLGGSISAVAYPTVVTFSVVNQVTGEVVFTADYPVADNLELDAILINVIPPGPGKYCAEVCIPGCNTKRILCFDVCEPFDVYKDSCNHWHIHRPEEGLLDEYLVVVRELGSTEDPVVNDITWNITEVNIFEFEVPGDGIYIVEMKDPATGDVIYSFSLFETCALQECFKILMDKIMCSCSDPCCKKCDGNSDDEMKFARMTLNKLVPLYLTYLGMARRDELYGTGMFLISDDHMCFLHDASQILDKINDIIKDCGCLCPEQKNTATNRGDCLSC